MGLATSWPGRTDTARKCGQTRTPRRRREASFWRMSAEPVDEVTPPGTGPGLGLLGPRTRHLLTLEVGSTEEFDDPRLEWRRLFSELLGTVALVLVAAGGGILHGEGQISLAAAVVAPG